MVTSVKRGRTWSDTVAVGSMIDTTEVPGLLVLNGPSPLIGGASHFQCYLPLLEVEKALIEERLSPDVGKKIFEESLQTAWGTLGLLSPANVMWVASPERYKPLLNAAIQFWDMLYAEGDRYSVGLETGQDLWSIHTNLKYVLANMGISPAILKAPLPMGGLEALIQLAGNCKLD
jgi:hypothetical protein